MLTTPGVDINSPTDDRDRLKPPLREEDLEIAGRAGRRRMRRHDIRGDRGGSIFTDRLSQLISCLGKIPGRFPESR